MTGPRDGGGDSIAAIIEDTLAFLKRVTPRGDDEADRLMQLIEWYEQTKRSRVR